MRTDSMTIDELEAWTVSSGICKFERTDRGFITRKGSESLELYFGRFSPNYPEPGRGGKQFVSVTYSGKNCGAAHPCVNMLEVELMVRRYAERMGIVEKPSAQLSLF